MVLGLLILERSVLGRVREVGLTIKSTAYQGYNVRFSNESELGHQLLG